jgi:hypothetical protein
LDTLFYAHCYAPYGATESTEDEERYEVNGEQVSNQIPDKYIDPIDNYHVLDF